MPTFMFEAIDAATGKEIRDTVDATNADEAQAHYTVDGVHGYEDQGSESWSSCRW